MKNHEITLGIYRHKKGNLYLVIGIGKHTETGDKFVIYHSVENPNDIWIRPFDMFVEPGRFEFLGKEAPMTPGEKVLDAVKDGPKTNTLLKAQANGSSWSCPETVK